MKIEYSEEDLKRFWKKVNKHDNCWNWIAGKDKDGYGLFKLNGKSIRSHRFSYYVYNNFIDQSLMVLHICDNPSCVNPDHLKQGTAQDNITDMDNKNRRNMKSGARKTSHLSEDDIINMRQMCLNKDYSYSQIGKLYNISITEVSRIARGIRWKDVKGVLSNRKNINVKLKLTYQDAMSIRKMHSDGIPQWKLCKIFNITSSHISGIINNKKWKVKE